MTLDLVSSPRSTRVAVVQLAYHPAALLDMRSPLEDPLFHIKKTDSLMPTNGHVPLLLEERLEALKRRVRAVYCEQLTGRLQAILAACSEWGVRVVVLPEYSVPWDVLAAVAAVADEMVVVAGTHQVEQGSRGIYTRLGWPKEQVPANGTAVCPVLFRGRLVGLQAKLRPAEPERKGFKPGTAWAPIRVDEALDDAFGVLICLDFLHRDHQGFSDLVGPRLKECRFLCVPSLTPDYTISEFAARAEQEARRYGRPVLYCDIAEGGGTAIFVDEGAPRDLRDFPIQTGSLDPGDEGVIVADIDLGTRPAGSSTMFESPLTVTSYAAASLVYTTHPVLAQYAELLMAWESLGEGEEGLAARIAAIEASRAALLNVAAIRGQSRERRLRRMLGGLQRVSDVEELRKFTREVVLPPHLLPFDALRLAMAQGAGEQVFAWLRKHPGVGMAEIEERLRTASAKLTTSDAALWNAAGVRALDTVRKAMHTDLDSHGPSPESPTVAPKLSVDLHEAAMAAYRQTLLERVRPMMPVGVAAGAASFMDLEAIFVEPKWLEEVEIHRADKLVAVAAEDDHAAQAMLQEEWDASAVTVGPQIIREPRDWKELLPGPGRPAVLVSGKIGTGKSTALRIVTRRLCRGDAALPDHLHSVTPVYVDLPSFARSGAVTLMDHAASDERGLGVATLQALDTAGRLLWVLDGLDEVMAPLARTRTIAAVESLATGADKRLVLVASRLAPTPLLSARFARFTLAPWDDDSIEKLIIEYHRRILQAADAESRAATMLQKLRANAALYGLCQTPLMLSLVLSVGRSGKIPWPRHRLYREALEYLLEEWDVPKSLVQVATVNTGLEDKLAFVRKLAWAMVSRARVTLPGVEVDRIAVDFFSGMSGETPDSARRLGPALVEEMVLRGNLLIAVGDGEFAFSHRAWSDYAGALELLAQPGALREMFAANWTEPAWTELLLVATGLVADKNPGEVVPLLHGVLHSRPTLSLEVLVRPLGFVVRALGYCVHILQQPIPAFAQAITNLMLEVGLRDDRLWPIASALRESGAAWPGAEHIRQAARTEEEFWLALAVCEPKDRVDVLLQCLEIEIEPISILNMLRAARALGRWNETELQRLLAISAVGVTHLGPLMTPNAHVLHVAAGILALEPETLAIDFFQAELSEPEPERRAYAALVLLGTTAADEHLLTTLTEALELGIWQKYVPGPIRVALRGKVKQAARTLGDSLRECLRKIIVNSRSSLVRGWSEEFSPDNIRVRDQPDQHLRELLGIGEGVPMTEQLITEKLRERSPEIARMILENIVVAEIVPPAAWRLMAMELLGRCEEDEEQFLMLRLLGDLKAVRRLARSKNSSMTELAEETLRLAKALDAVLQVGAGVKRSGRRQPR